MLFRFVKRAGRCDLKSDKQAVKLSRTYAEVASGTLKLRQGAGWHNEKGSISTLKIVSAEKASQCEEPCRQTRGCVGWTYVRVRNLGVDLFLSSVLNTACFSFYRDPRDAT